MVFGDCLVPATSHVKMCCSVAARVCLPPGAISVLPPRQSDGNWYSYAYNEGIGVDCEQYAKLRV